MTQPAAPPDESWRDADPAALRIAYREAYPNTGLTDAALDEYHRQGKRFRESTRRLVGPESRNSDFTARYRGDEQLVALTGGNRADLSTSDAQTLDTLLQARDRAREQRDNAPSSGGAAKHQQQMITASRQIGEHAGRAWVQEKYPGPPPPVSIYPADPPVSGPGDFDQIFECTVTENGQSRIVCIINETKGGASPLGTRMTPEGRAQQGTPEYYASILSSMEKRGNPAAAAADRVRTAQSVEYCHVHAPIKHVQQPDGTVRSEAGKATVKTFDLSNREPDREAHAGLNPGPTTTLDAETVNAEAGRESRAAPSGQMDPASLDAPAPVTQSLSSAGRIPAQSAAPEPSSLAKPTTAYPVEPTTTTAEPTEPANPAQAEEPTTIKPATEMPASTEPVSDEDAELAQMRAAAEPGAADSPRASPEPSATPTTPTEPTAAESVEPTTPPAEPTEPANLAQAEEPTPVESTAEKPASTEPVSDEDAELVQMRAAAEPGATDSPRAGPERSATPTEQEELAPLRAAVDSPEPPPPDPPAADSGPAADSRPAGDSKPAGVTAGVDPDADELAQMRQATASDIGSDDSSRAPAAETERTIGDDQ